MKFFVEYKIFDGIIPNVNLQDMRQAFAKQLEQISKSGKLKDSGLFVGVRGGYLIIETDSAPELHGLLSPGIVDTCDVKIHPLMSAQDLQELFKNQQR